MSLKKTMNQNRAIIVVGKTDTEKMKKAMTFVSEDPIVVYANEYDITDRCAQGKHRTDTQDDTGIQRTGSPVV